MRSLTLSALLLLVSSVHALDFGSLIQTVAPVAQSAAPAVDMSLSSNPLIKNITTTLGVTPTQAIGGTAAIINDAKGNMKPTDYTALTKQMPQVGPLLSSVPSTFLNTGTTASQFSLLGMDPALITKFSPLILTYLQSGATPGMDAILATAFAQ